MKQVGLKNISIAARQRLVFFMIVCSGLGGMLYGYDIGVISGALLFVQKAIPMSDWQTGLIVGAVLGGGFIANLMTGQLSDFYGRRSMIIVASLIFMSGIFCITIANSFLTLFFARLLLGLGIGVVSVAVPLYLSEVAPTAIRGMSVTVFQLFLTFGIVAAYVFDLFFMRSGNWRGMFSIILFPAIALLVTMLKLPESPRFLVAKSEEEAAREVLICTRPSFEVNLELQAIKDSLKQTSSSWRELFSRKWARPLFIALFVAASNQLTGINSILQYAPLIFKNAGISSHSVLMQHTIIIGCVNFFTSIVAMFLVDKVGRRALLIFGTTGLIFADLFLGWVLHAHLATTLAMRLQLLGLIIYIFAFAIGPGVVVWLVFSELLPTKVRGRGVALCLFVNSLCSAVLASVFLQIVDYFGMANTYWLFGFFTFLYWLVAVFLLPETKGKSLEQVQAGFAMMLEES